MIRGPVEHPPGTVLRVPLGDGTAAMAQVVGAGPGIVAVSVADIIWDCEPGLLDWHESGRALLHLALKPDGLADVIAVGEAPIDPAAVEAHRRWAEAPQITAAPITAIVGALLGP